MTESGKMTHLSPWAFRGCGAYFSGNIIVSCVIQNGTLGEVEFRNPRFIYFVCKYFWVFEVVHFISKFYFASSLARSACDSLEL
jgi:hypothetical protein